MAGPEQKLKNPHSGMTDVKMTEKTFSQTFFFLIKLQKHNLRNEHKAGDTAQLVAHLSGISKVPDSIPRTVKLFSFQTSHFPYS